MRRHRVTRKRSRQLSRSLEETSRGHKSQWQPHPLLTGRAKGVATVLGGLPSGYLSCCDACSPRSPFLPHPWRAPAMPMSSSTTVSAIQPTSPWQPPASHAGRSSSWLSHGNKLSPPPHCCVHHRQARRDALKNGRAADTAEEQKNMACHGPYKSNIASVIKTEGCIIKVDLSPPSSLPQGEVPARI